jgi:hypothetical protein
MRVLIRRKVDGFYRTRAGVWTPWLAQAQDFKSSLSAILFCMEHELSQVQVVLKSAVVWEDVYLPAHEIPHFYMPCSSN